MQHALAALFTLILCAAPGVTSAGEPLRGLLLTSPGVYHDYAYQTRAITGALARGVHITFDVSLQELERWKHTDFSKGYDVIVYNLCTADNTDAALIANLRRQTEILGTPAMVLHCAMHSFRNTDQWWPMYGLKTTAHEAIGEMPLSHAGDHAILTGIGEDWTLENDELYINLAFEARALLTAPGEDGNSHVIAWTADAGGTRVFGTTMGHSSETIADPSYQRLLLNGLLWVTGQLQADGTAPAHLQADSTTPPIGIESKAKGVQYLDDEGRECTQSEIVSEIGPCYAGCVLHPFKWGEAAAACKQDCVAGIPPSDELIARCTN